MRGPLLGGRWSGQGWVGQAKDRSPREGFASPPFFPTPTPPAGRSGLQEWQGLTSRLLPHLSLLIYLEANLGLWPRGLERCLCLCWCPSPGPNSSKSLESPIACSNDFQVAIMFPTQGNWLYQLLMDYLKRKKHRRREATVTPPDFVVWLLGVQWHAGHYHFTVGWLLAAW